MQNWLLPSLSDLFNRLKIEDGDTNGGQQTLTDENSSGENNWHQAQLKAQKEWRGAIAALENLLLSVANLEEEQSGGLVLSGTTPVLSQEVLLNRFHTGIFTPEAFDPKSSTPFQLPAAKDSKPKAVPCPIAELPLLPQDPIATEQFCLVFTSDWGLLIVLGKDSVGFPAFQFTFAPEQLQQAWIILRSRLVATKHPQLERLDALTKQFLPSAPDYRLVSRFTRQLLEQLREAPSSDFQERWFKPAPSHTEGQDRGKVVQLPQQRVKRQVKATESPEVELLQALTHEIRTPLTTIRTLTRSLLKRAKLAPNVLKRLESIDQECTEQINRMELIFRAAELETRPVKQQLSPICLEYLFQQSIPCWKKQAQRRGVVLDVVLPNKLPTVISDPAMLNQVLTGLMEKFTRSLSDGGQIRVQVTTAGNQLKLQFVSLSDSPSNRLKSLGQLLMFQPETGSLSLNLDVTKNLFHAMGGKLIVRQRPQQGEVLTIFLPLVGSGTVDTAAERITSPIDPNSPSSVAQ